MSTLQDDVQLILHTDTFKEFAYLTRDEIKAATGAQSFAVIAIGGGGAA